MKSIRKALSLLLCVVFCFGSFSSAFAATAKPLNKSDFVIKIGKEKFDLLTMENSHLEKMMKKKFKLANTDDEGVKYYQLVTFTGIFVYFKMDAPEQDFTTKFVQCVYFTKYGVTPRGIKIGSTEKDMLTAYPKAAEVKKEKDDDGNKVTLYRYYDPDYKFEYDEEELKGLEEKRPYQYYGIEFTVNEKTKKVSGIFYYAVY